MAYATLIIFVILFWLAAAFYPKFVSLRVGGTISYLSEFGSTLWIILVWCAIGTLLNLLYPWLGTWAVVAVHAGAFAVTIGCVVRHRRTSRRSDGVA